MNQEIEVKARLENPDAVRQALLARSCTFSEPITQHDTVFIGNGVSYEAAKPGDIFLRVRETPKGSTFTMKQTIKNELDCAEAETEIADPEAMKQALKIMGYEYVVTVQKTRQTCACDGYTICLDTVSELGDFIEVEKLVDGEADGDVVQAELVAFLETLGVPASARVVHGYDTLVYRLTHPA
ncbi:MAG: hypothetical protein RL150_161 [Candidatus Parcubacteria bacterium]|jgi:adenylate cyclase class 2